MLEAVLAAFVVSLATLVGIVLLRSSKRTMLYLVSFATGTFLGAFFLHILPRVSAVGDVAFPLILVSFVVFALLEKSLHFHEHFAKRSIGWINLIGDFLHNMLDGIGIAAAFKMGQPFGWLFTFVVLAHEVPQELGDFAILIYSGFEKKKALLLNFLVGLSAIVGVVIGWFTGIDPRLLVAFVGGSFLYLAASDLVPLLREELRGGKDLFIGTLLFTLGVLLMWFIRTIKV